MAPRGDGTERDAPQRDLFAHFGIVLNHGLPVTPRRGGPPGAASAGPRTPPRSVPATVCRACGWIVPAAAPRCALCSHVRETP